MLFNSNFDSAELATRGEINLDTALRQILTKIITYPRYKKLELNSLYAKISQVLFNFSDDVRKILLQNLKAHDCLAPFIIETNETPTKIAAMIMAKAHIAKEAEAFLYGDVDNTDTIEITTNISATDIKTLFRYENDLRQHEFDEYLKRVNEMFPVFHELLPTQRIISSAHQLSDLYYYNSKNNPNTLFASLPKNVLARIAAFIDSDDCDLSLEAREKITHAHLHISPKEKIALEPTQPVRRLGQ